VACPCRRTYSPNPACRALRIRHIACSSTYLQADGYGGPSPFAGVQSHYRPAYAAARSKLASRQEGGRYYQASFRAVKQGPAQAAGINIAMEGKHCLLCKESLIQRLNARYWNQKCLWKNSDTLSRRGLESLEKPSERSPGDRRLTSAVKRYPEIEGQVVPSSRNLLDSGRDFSRICVSKGNEDFRQGYGAISFI